MKNKKLLIVLICVLAFFLILIPFIAYRYLVKDFWVKEFKEVVLYNYQEKIEYDSGEVCYGNKRKCSDVLVSRDKDVDSNIIGSEEITYTYKYGNKTMEKKQIIKIIDNIAPLLEIQEDSFKMCSLDNISVDYKATDNYDGDITDKVEIKYQDNRVIFRVEDSSGNKTIKEIEAKIMDDEAPIISLNGGSYLYVKLNGVYEEMGARASDNCDGDITDKIEITGEVNPQVIGEYVITYKVRDKVGNESSVNRKVYVYPLNNYEAPTGKSIYLTFDDGPGPYTSKLLDILKKYQVPATFFVTDQALTKNYDSVILRAFNEGHTIGLHSKTHNYSIYKNSEAYFEDLYAIQDKVKRITGYTSTIIRFPGGSSNTVSRNYDNGSHIMSELSKAVEAKGFRYWDWNVSSGDAGETTSTSRVVANVTSALKNGPTYVVLQHDIKGFSVNAVEEIILYGLSHGYTFRALTMESPTVHHRINN